MLLSYFHGNAFPTGIVQQFARAPEHQFRMIVDFAQVSEKDDLQGAMVNTLQEVAGFRIGEVTVTTADALL